MNSRTLERLREADPLAGRLPELRPVPTHAAAIDQAVGRRRSVRLRYVVAASATVCAITVIVLVDSPDGQPLPNTHTTAGRPADGNAADTRDDSVTEPRLPRSPAGDATIRFASINSQVGGTLRLPVNATEQAQLRLHGLRRKSGRRYGVWLLSADSKAKFMGYIASSDSDDTRIPLPRGWQNYSSAVVTAERRGQRPNRPGTTLAKAALP